MTSKFPAILIGGPPHRGKTVFAHRLSQLLRARGCAHFRLPANPDGEGDWFQEAPPAVAAGWRRPHDWDERFERALARALRQRPLPYLVDAGGKPTPSQQALFAHCTHAIILGESGAERREWRDYAARYGLQLLAEIDSTLVGEDAILTETLPLALRLSGLVRQPKWEQPSTAWACLVDVVEEALAWDEAALWAFQQDRLPFNALPVNLEQWLPAPAGGARRWEASHLPALLTSLPEAGRLALYGRAPVWLYAAIALHHPGPLLLFDAHYGWMSPPELRPAAEGAWLVERHVSAVDCTLAFWLGEPHTIPEESDAGPLPAGVADRPLLLTGKLPAWLYMALARAYAAHDGEIALALPQGKVVIPLRGPTLGTTRGWDAPISPLTPPS